MTKEQRTILDLLCGRDIAEDVNWQEVYNISCQQGVAAIVFDEVQRLFKARNRELNIPTEVKLQWFALQCQIEKQNQKVNKVLDIVVGSLDSNGIPSVLLKGQGLAMLYKNPLHRQSGDIDLYVGTENYGKARKLFVEQGWLQKGCYHEDIKHLGFSLDGILLEIHYYSALIPGRKENKRFQQLMENGLCNADDCSSIRILPPMENLVFTFAHLFGHFIGGGITLRQLMDWALLLRNTDVDETVLRECLSETGFLESWQMFGCVLTKYFGFAKNEIPCYDTLFTTKADFIIDIILGYGTKNRNTSRFRNGILRQAEDYARYVRGYVHIYKMFPKESCAYLMRVLQNTSTKYLHLAIGAIH